MIRNISWNSVWIRYLCERLLLLKSEVNFHLPSAKQYLIPHLYH